MQTETVALIVLGVVALAAAVTCVWMAIARGKAHQHAAHVIGARAPFLGKSDRRHGNSAALPGRAHAMRGDHAVVRG